MSEIKFEPDKFIVINRKHIKELDKFLNDNGAPTATRSTVLLSNAIQRFGDSCAMNTKPLKQKYYVCNQDEPYADEVLKVILEGEKIKLKIPNLEVICSIIDRKYNKDHETVSTIKCPFCGKLIDYLVLSKTGYIKAVCETDDCINGGTEDIIKSQH